MKQNNDAIVSYTIKMPKSLREYFEEIARNEQRDLSFIIRRVLVKEKHEIEQQKQKDNN